VGLTVTYEWDATEGTWTVLCEHDEVVERGYYELADAVAETEGHTCEH
jgi:hypothetical protein